MKSRLREMESILGSYLSWSCRPISMNLDLDGFKFRGIDIQEV